MRVTIDQSHKEKGSRTEINESIYGPTLGKVANRQLAFLTMSRNLYKDAFVRKYWTSVCRLVCPSSVVLLCVYVVYT